MTTPARRHRAALAVACALLAGCGDTPNDPTPNGSEAATIELTEAPAANSGEATALSVRVLDDAGEALAGATLRLEPQHGSVETTELVTDGDGSAAIVWQLEDIDVRQVLRVRSGDAQLEVAVTTRPRLASIAIQGLAPTLAFGDTTPGVVVAGQSPTGRVVSVPQPITLELLDEARRWMDLPVAALVGTRRVVASGPGTIAVRASAAGLLSAPVTVEVPALPIVRGLEPAEVPTDGGVVVIDGYDLDLLEAADVLVDGAEASILDGDDSSMRIAVPPAPVACSGRDGVTIDLAGAHSLIGTLGVRRARAGTLDLEVGAMHRLGRVTDLCVKLGYAAPGAEYVLAWFDPRGIESARNGMEDANLKYGNTRVNVSDRSMPAPATGVSGRASSRALASGDTGLDIVRVESSSASSSPPAVQMWDQRTTPWAVGDSFALRNDFGQPEPGAIFYANRYFAVGSLARDAGYDVPARIRNVANALQKFERDHLPWLLQAFGVGRPVTTSGSDQMLIVVGDFWAAGLMFIGTGTVDRGAYIGIDPGVAEMPAGSDLYFQENVIFHELAHAFQDRYVMERCNQTGDCGWDMWNNTWAVEGGADMLTFHMMLDDLDMAIDGNHPSDGFIANALGLVTYYGTMETPHYGFSFGYASSSWLLEDVVQRLVVAGVDLPSAAGAVAVGAFEGWYGHGDNGAQRPGLVERVSALSGGTWDPVDAALRGLLSFGADERVASDELRVRYLQRAWEWLRPGGLFELDGTTNVDVTLQGLGFTHYRINDAAGLGGTLEIGTGNIPGEWAIVRTR